MHAFNWKPFMERWNRMLLNEDDEDMRFYISEEALKSQWLGKAGATEAQLKQLEARLRMPLPPSYREFLAFSNGWAGALTLSIHHLWSTDDVNWFRVRHQQWIDAWTEYEDDPDQIKALKNLLEISEVSVGADNIIVLNPMVIDGRGEWEAWSWHHEDIAIYPSFRELMEAEYEHVEAYIADLHRPKPLNKNYSSIPGYGYYALERLRQSMKIQIYTMQTSDEAVAVANAGVDLIGVTPAMRGLPGEVSYETARQIVQAVAGKALRVALTVDADPAQIIAMVNAVQPDILHLCGMPGELPPAAVADLRKQIPNVQIMQAVSVNGAEAVQTALDYQSVADYLILDTSAPDIPGVGASGKTHDWNISRQIVQQVKIPVILAGGLSPDNVADAVRAVQPWGVDSLTHTSQFAPDGTFRKDIARVRRFVAAARGTEPEE